MAGIIISYCENIDGKKNLEDIDNYTVVDRHYTIGYNHDKQIIFSNLINEAFRNYENVMISMFLKRDDNTDKINIILKIIEEAIVNFNNEEYRLRSLMLSSFDFIESEENKMFNLITNILNLPIKNLIFYRCFISSTCVDYIIKMCSAEQLIINFKPNCNWNWEWTLITMRAAFFKAATKALQESKFNYFKFICMPQCWSSTRDSIISLNELQSINLNDGHDLEYLMLEFKTVDYSYLLEKLNEILSNIDSISYKIKFEMPKMHNQEIKDIIFRLNNCQDQRRRTFNAKKYTKNANNTAISYNRFNQI